MKKTAILMAVMSLLLSACSGGPSKSDAQQALLDQLNTNPVIHVDKIDDFKMGECTKVSDGTGYACSVEGKATIPVTESRSMTQPIQATVVFDKIDGKWKAVGHR